MNGTTVIISSKRCGPRQASQTQPSHSRTARHCPCFDQLCRAPEPYHADAHAPIHSANQRLFEEGREPRSRGRAPHDVLQLRPFHKTLRVTPAMAAGLTDRLWEIADIAKLVEDAEAKPAKRGPYKKG